MATNTNFSAKQLALELLKETKSKSELLKSKDLAPAMAQVETLRILQVLDNFKQRLDKYGKLKLLPEIVREFKSLLEAEVNESIVFVKSSIPLNEDQVNKIKQKVSKLFKKDINVYVSVDKNFSGGLVLKYKDKIIDLSVDSKLDDLINNIIKK